MHLTVAHGSKSHRLGHFSPIAPTRQGYAVFQTRTPELRVGDFQFHDNLRERSNPNPLIELFSAKPVAVVSLFQPFPIRKLIHQPSHRSELGPVFQASFLGTHNFVPTVLAFAATIQQPVEALAQMQPAPTRARSAIPRRWPRAEPIYVPVAAHRDSTSGLITSYGLTSLDPGRPVDAEFATDTIDRFDNVGSSRSLRCHIGPKRWTYDQNEVWGDFHGLSF